MTNQGNDSVPVGGYLTAFAVGALIGAGIALLYAPQSGRETRKLIAQKGKELQDMARETIGDTTEFIRGKKAELGAAFEAGREAMREERSRHPDSA